jgi:hypothetical protein
MHPLFGPAVSVLFALGFSVDFVIMRAPLWAQLLMPLMGVIALARAYSVWRRWRTKPAVSS